MQMRGAAWSANPPHPLAACHTVTDAENNAGRVEMSIKRVDAAAIGQNVLHDDGTFVGAPSQRCGICHHTMPNAMNWQAKRSSAWAPPIFTRVISTVVGPKYTKVVPSGDIFSVGRL